MNDTRIASLIALEVGRRWLNNKGMEIGQQALTDLCALSLVNSHYRRLLVPYIFQSITFDGQDNQRPWARGSQNLSVLDIIRSNWWTYIQIVVVKCDTSAFEEDEAARDQSLRQSLGHPELGYIFRFLHAATTLRLVEIDLSQSDEAGLRSPIPWGYFATNMSAIETFLKEWPRTRRMKELIVRNIRMFPVNDIRQIESLYLDTSTLHWAPVIINPTPSSTTFLRLFRSPRALQFFRFWNVYPGFLTSLRISVCNSDEFDDTYWLMGRANSTVETITLSFRYFDLKEEFPSMNHYHPVAFPVLNSIIIEFQADYIGAHLYPFLHKLKDAADTLHTMQLVAYGKEFPDLRRSFNLPGSQSHLAWCFFEALTTSSDVFPGLRRVVLELAKNAQQATGSTTSEPIGLDLYRYRLKRARNVEITFRSYEYD